MRRPSIRVTGIVALIVIVMGVVALIFLQTASQETKETLNLETTTVEAENAFYLLQSESTLLQMTPHGEYYFAMGEVIPVEDVPIGNIKLYIMSKKDGEYQILASYECDPILSPGFVVEALHFDEMTIIFGGVGEKFVLFPGGETSVPFDTVEVKAIYSKQQEKSVKINQNGIFLFVSDAPVDICDIQFLVNGAAVTSYATVYNSPPEIHQINVLDAGSDVVNGGFKPSPRLLVY